MALAITNALTSPPAEVNTQSSQVSVAAEDATKTAFGAILSKQLADAAVAVEKKAIVTEVLDADGTQILPTKAGAQSTESSVSLSATDLLTQIAVPAEISVQQELLPDEKGLLPKTSKKPGTSDDESNGISLSSETQQDVLLANTVNLVGNPQPTVANSDGQSGKELPLSVTGIQISTKNPLDQSVKIDPIDESAVETHGDTEFASKLDASINAADSIKTNTTNNSNSNLAVSQPTARLIDSAPSSSGIPQQVGTPHWESGLSDRVVWLVGSQTQSAQLHLNPPNLGPLEIRLSIVDGQTNLSFITQHVAVKDAIDAASPRLHSTLSENGINLGSVSVNVGTSAQQQSWQQQESQKSSVNEVASIHAQNADVIEPIVKTSQSIADSGIVNVFA